MDDYVESVRAAGGEPVLLSNDDDPADVLQRIDAILLTGGADVDPALYDQPKHASTETDPKRDAFEVPLSRAALASDVPVFAICRGVQVLNVAAGGTLVQDIPTEAPTTIEHSLTHQRDARAHDVEVKPGTRLASLLSGSQSPETCSVNSRHHQAVGDIAPSFIVSALSPDGIVEAIERTAAPFCLGVQWHPENFWRTGEFLRLFRGFVAAAGEERRRKKEEGKEVEEAENGKPVERTESGKPVERTEGGKPVERTESRKPVERTESGKPVERTESRKPVERTESRKPVERTESRKPVERTESRKPVERTESRKPVKEA